MLPTAHLFNEIHVPAGAARAALKQAAVWGLGGALASRLSRDKKPMTKEEKKEALKDLATQAFAGAAAGAAGALV
jgi:hypothetical protein